MQCVTCKESCILSVWFCFGQTVIFILVVFHIFLHTVQVKLDSRRGVHDKQQRQSKLVDISRYLPEEVLRVRASQAGGFNQMTQLWLSINIREEMPFQSIQGEGLRFVIQLQERRNYGGWSAQTIDAVMSELGDYSFVQYVGVNLYSVNLH